MNFTAVARVAKLATAGALVANLAGCFGLAAGAVVMTGLSVSDRRTVGAQTEDKAIIVKGEAKIVNLYPNAHVNVTSYNRRVLLTGETPDAATKAAVAREIGAIENVAAVNDEVEVAGVSSLTSRSNDTLITSKVVASLVEKKDIPSSTIKVVTERGAVYLMGRVTTEEGNAAAEVTAGVSGVAKVVKLFEYISEEEKQRLTKSANKAS